MALLDGKMPDHTNPDFAKKQASDAKEEKSEEEEKSPELPPERVTIVKKVVIEEREVTSPLGDSSLYLYGVAGLLVTLLIVIATICLIRRCNNKKVRTIAEAVQRDERQKQLDFDVIVTS